MAKTTTIRMPGTPRPWMNTIMRLMLRTPGVQRIAGKTFGIISFTGSVSGNRYTTPVQYFRYRDDYVVLSQQMRVWWRNFTKQPGVQLLVRGRTVEGRAEVADADTARMILATVLEENPRVAKFYGIGVDDGGTIDPAGIDQLLGHVVVILIVSATR